MNPPKRYISANDLLQQSFQLAEKVWQDQYRPDAIVGIWRGGAPVAVALHEYFHWKGHEAAHFPLSARSYRGLDQRGEVSIVGLDALAEQLRPMSSLLLVDDVVDSGNTLAALLDALASAAPSLDVRLAAPWFKPERLQVDVQPHYWLHETSDWLVFPHELMGLSEAEVTAQKPVGQA